MDRKFLEELGLEKETIDKVMKEHGKSLNDYKEKADKHDGLVTQVDDLTNQLKERDGQLEELKKVDADALQQTIDDLQEENKNKDIEYQEKLEKQAKSFAVESYLRDQNAKNVTAVKALIDDDAITFKDGKLIGIDEQITPLKESDAYLFGEEEPPGLKGRKPHEPGKNPPPVDKNPFSDEHFNLTEQGRLFNEDPDLYKQLKAQAGK